MRGRNLTDSTGKFPSSEDADWKDLPKAAQEGRSARIGRELEVLSVIAVSAFLFLSLVSFEFGDGANLCGPVGQSLASALYSMFGHCAILLAVGLVGFAWARWRRLVAGSLARLSLGFGALIVVLSTLGAAVGGADWGGAFGTWMARLLTSYVSIGGTTLLLALVALYSLALLFGVAPVAFLFSAVRAIKRSWSGSGGRDSQSCESALPVGGEVEILLEPEAAVDLAETPESSQPDQNKSQSGTTRSPQPVSPVVRSSRSRLKLPPLSLLDKPPVGENSVDRDALERSARVLEQKLADFGVMGRVVEVEPGPVISMYKFEPASGIKVSQVVNLADDLSLALKAPSIRIQAPVPGEAVVGIEVPNRKREKIYLREILEAPEFAAAGSNLTIALGKTINGQPAVADLAKMPHLLIAGATGAGKSVALHAMIASILFNATAEEVRFILIDPKMLELSVYEGIPHLLVPVVVDPDKAAAALFWATQEMERRYRVMRELGVRNIDGYNETLRNNLQMPYSDQSSRNGGGDQSSNGDPPIEHRPLPKIVIVIDELADLMLSEGKSVERDITRLAQKARAAGIHLILATQRPSVDIITGLIKANMPARISFQVASRVDSRTILDTIGAERLLGDGDMLFMPPGSGRLKRMHGPFVSESEIRKVTDFLRRQGAPDYQMDILEAKRFDSASAGALEEKDEMYDEAVRIVTETNQASISMIQRRLRIGYNRAARIVEQMEREGIVSPGDGLRPREVRKLRIIR